MSATQQTAALFFRIIYILLFIITSVLVILNVDMENMLFVNSDKILLFLDYLTLLVQEGVKAMGGLAQSITTSILGAKSGIFLIGDPDIGSLSANLGVIQQSIGAIFEPSNSLFPHSTIAEGADILEDFSFFFGATTILMLLPIAFLSGLGFIREGDTKLAIYSFLGFQLILIISIFTQNNLMSTVINTSGNNIIEGLINMITSPIFTLGFLLYLLLEVAFQTSYTLNIIEPMAEREKRIQKHLMRIRTFVPPTEELEMTTDTAIKSVQSKKFGLLASSYLREMVERRVFRSGETVQDAKSMMRLQSYLANLKQSDPEVDLKLAAQTAQPDISSLIKYFVPIMLVRVFAVVLISYIVMAPEGLLNIFMPGSFPALLDSLEITQPEFQTIAILNTALGFILIGVIIRYLSTGRTATMLERVVQQVTTLTDFDRSSPQPTTMDEESVDEQEEEELEEEEEEEIS